ncbi:hypothetical protein [Delftia phage PhiW-14]|uniref:Uncharacterized protein n=1 Tax=Delftia phage PhiW-14 TaxID=665032 RepID=C9DGB2_BPW14|nr:hypothetical protein DP-phiW-14_gp142 [Delftia phage PhiW-14]ACV50163.1 hypothetical protein [Delftia phage PhiW-14]
MAQIQTIGGWMTCTDATTSVVQSVDGSKVTTTGAQGIPLYAVLVDRAVVAQASIDRLAKSNLLERFIRIEALKEQVKEYETQPLKRYHYHVSGSTGAEAYLYHASQVRRIMGRYPRGAAQAVLANLPPFPVK